MLQTVIESANERDREAIFRIRHDIYGQELGQHGTNETGLLRDALDGGNVYLVARQRGEIAGFISITPPELGMYSFEKYVARSECRFQIHNRLFEIRLLTVARPQRGGALASLLMWSAMRWVCERGGTHVVAIGRREVLSLYLKMGFQLQGQSIPCGSVEFELLHADTKGARKLAEERLRPVIERIAESVDWKLDFPLFPPSGCLHGGAFFDGIGSRFDNLERRLEIINADVLDAWFPPAPGVTANLQRHLPWLAATSPPVHADGLIQEIASARGIPAASILPGAGSSALIFLAFREWLRPESRVLILDPMYGEYRHVLENVVSCRAHRFPLHRSDGFRIDMARWADAASSADYDLVVLVNPNNPTGAHVPREDVESALSCLPPRTRVWLDEAYVEYAGANQSLEQFAAESENVVVCKSMSKAYALSGLRVAYLCGSPALLNPLRALTPPWAVGLPAQVAAVESLKDPEYYARRHEQTHELRGTLTEELARLGLIQSSTGVINAVLCDLPPDGPNATNVVERCRNSGLYLRAGCSISARLGRRTVRIAVKDETTNRRIVEILRTAVHV